jgi:hypothetical protein
MSWGIRLLHAAAALAGAAVFATAAAAANEHCGIPLIYTEPFAPLPRATIAAKRDGKLDILLLSGSPSQTGAAKGLRSYPSFFEEGLRNRLPKLAVNLVVRTSQRRTASELLPTLEKSLAETKPSLVIWQAGTADAYRGIDPDDFAEALRKGVDMVLRSGADIILIDLQYSPRTDRLINSTDYIATTRRVATAADVPLFGRYDIMRYWNDFGVFDLASLKNDGLYERVHSCIGDLLAGFVVRAAELNEFRGAGK